ncbi:MAG: hypothetical protein IJH79_10115 [Lentisphaeria bacterium]|nr:hypothetical protein [Lentisphaeria bacterium]MBQ7207556.1 hypothetical protein [Lentisphaeria bacterium]
MDWKDINADYEAFRRCIYGPANPGEVWVRDDRNGRRHLLDAYVKASMMPEKDHRLYARILWSMYQAFEAKTWPSAFFMPEADGFLAEASKEYELAKAAADGAPTESEMKNFEQTVSVLQDDENRQAYELEQTKDDDWDYKRHLPLAINHDLLQDFIFHDGVILKFEHRPVEQAIIVQVAETFFSKQVPGKLKVATLRFDGIEDVEYNYEKDSRWLSDVRIFPAYEHPEVLVFEFDGFRIYCDKITVVKLETIKCSAALNGFVCGGEWDITNFTKNK